MRRALCAILSLGVVACSEPDLDVEPSVVSWMEWPEEVPVATPFSVHLTTSTAGCGVRGTVQLPVSVSNSAVTFEPVFLVEGRDNVVCVARAMEAAVVGPGYKDTTAVVPGLPAQYPRSYEMRATASVYVPQSVQAGTSLPVRTFGQVIVRQTVPPGGRTNVGGQAFATPQPSGCVRLRPLGRFDLPGGGYVLENPPNASSYWFGFVRGYVYEPATPVCGESRVFHLVSLD